MSKVSTLEELIKKYRSTTPALSAPDSYDVYKHKNRLENIGSYSNAVASLYAASKRGSSQYGANNRKLSNKGLQNSGYAAYVDSLSKNSFKSGAEALKDNFAKAEDDSRFSYAAYLDKYREKKETVKKSVMSHLVDNDVVDINTAIAYGMNVGLSPEDAKAIGESAYEITKQKTLNKILEQTVSLGLDKDGAKALALKMGISEEDANSLAEEVDDMLKYYSNISKEYLEFLEQRSN